MPEAHSYTQPTLGEEWREDISPIASFRAIVRRYVLEWLTSGAMAPDQVIDGGRAALEECAAGDAPGLLHLLTAPGRSISCSPELAARILAANPAPQPSAPDAVGLWGPEWI